jgi:hypothetical protein
MAPISVKLTDQSQSQRLILTFMTVIVAAAFVERYSGKIKQTATVPQIFIGAFVATALLILLSYALPEFAVGLAATAMVAMLITKGQPFWDAINHVVGATSNASTAQSPLANQAAQQTAANVAQAGSYSSQPL